MNKILQLLGVIFLLLILGFCIVIIYTVLNELIKNKITKYKIKTRYNKKPTARCYCRDCKLFIPDTGKCLDSCNSRYMGPGWFCCFAEPLTGELYKERDKYMKERGE